MNTQNPLQSETNTTISMGVFCRTLALVVLAVGCTTSPVTGRKQFNLMSTAQEVQMGAKNYAPYQQMEGGSYEVMPEITDYVRSVGFKLAKVSDKPSLPFDFVVLNNSVPNAWALPGGKIALNRGLLVELKSEAELAAVLSHEIVHAVGRHTANAMSKGMLLQTAVVGLGMAVSDHDYSDIIMAGAGLTAGMVGQKFSRDNERESDQYGIKYMHKAGYDTRAAVELQETFVKLAEKEGGSGGWGAGLFSSHPPSQERVDNNRKTLFTYAPGGFRGEKEYQDAIAHLIKTKPAYDKLGEGYKALAAGKPQQALALAREAQAIEPREALFHSLAAKAMAKQKDLKGALAEADKAVSLNPNYFEFLLMRGQLRQKLGIRGAREDLAASHRLLPTASAAASLGFMALEEGDRRTAAMYLGQAASNDSAEGRQAGAALARLELASNPGRYLETGGSLNARGELILQVANRAPVAVRGVTLMVWNPLRKANQRMRVPGVIAPGAVVNLPTGIGPFASVDQARQVRMEVQSAEVAEP